MAYIQKRQRKLKDGSPGPVRWIARYRDDEGRERSQHFDRRKDAERFIQRNGADLQTGDWIDPQQGRALFSEWADSWWATTVKLRPNTRRGYWLLLQNHVLPAFRSRHLGTIDYMDVERFIATKLEDGFGPKHVREMVNVVSLIMKCAIKGNALRDNPAAGHELRVRKTRVSQAAMLTMDQAVKVVGHTSRHYQPAMWLLLFTGLRPAELCGAKVTDLDFERRVLHAGPTHSPIGPYDGRAREHLDGPPKSDAGYRSIPLPHWLCEALAADLANRPGTVGPSDYLILNQHGQPLNRDTFRARIVRPALRKAGLPEDFRTYDFRHTHASLLIHDGADVLAIAQRLGHTDPAMTLRVYGHLFEGAQQDLTDRLDRRRQETGNAAQTLPREPSDSPVPPLPTTRP